MHKWAALANCSDHNQEWRSFFDTWFSSAPETVRILIFSEDDQFAKRVYFEFKLKYFLKVDLSAMWYLLNAVHFSQFWMVLVIVGMEEDNDPLGSFEGDKIVFQMGKFASKFKEVQILTDAAVARSNFKKGQMYVRTAQPAFYQQIFSAADAEKTRQLRLIDPRDEHREEKANRAVAQYLKDHGVPFKGVCKYHDWFLSICLILEYLLDD